MTQDEIATAIVKSHCLRTITIFIGPYYSKSSIQAYANQCYLKPINKARKMLEQMKISHQLYLELKAILDDITQFVCEGIIPKSLYAYNDNLANVKVAKNVNFQYEFNEFFNIDGVYEEVKYAIETKFDLLITEIDKRQEQQNMVK